MIISKITLVLLINSSILLNSLCVSQIAKNYEKKEKVVEYSFSQDFYDSILGSRDTSKSFVSWYRLSKREFVEVTRNYLSLKKFGKDSSWYSDHNDTFRVSEGTWYERIAGKYYLYFSKDSFNAHKPITHWYYPNSKPYILWTPMKVFSKEGKDIYKFTKEEIDGEVSGIYYIYFDPEIGIIKSERISSNIVVDSHSLKDLTFNEKYKKYYEGLWK